MAAIQPDLVQDVVFGATLVIAGIDIVRDAVEMLEKNAEQFLEQYVQKGGE